MATLTISVLRMMHHTNPIANEDYTIESWVYLTATPSAQRAQIIGIGEYGTNSDWLLAVNSDLGVTHYINPVID